MVYMAAGDSPELDAHAVRDLQEMERARFGTDVNVVVQIDRFWPRLAQRYQILPQGGTTLLGGDVKPGLPPSGGGPEAPDAPSESLAARGLTVGVTPTTRTGGTNMGHKDTLRAFI